jgi:SAM-dependent methyltransferase
MRWVAKAMFQKGVSVVPRAERVNYFLQRHVARTLPTPETRLRRKFRRALQHLEAYERYGPDRPLSTGTFYEVGAGWDLAIPLSFWTLGVERQILVDVRPNVRLPLVNVSIERLSRLGHELSRETGRSVRAPKSEGVQSIADLQARFGITYIAPCDARSTALDSGSVDFISSTVTLEHVPAEDLVPLLRECHRLLKADGVLSALIDLTDHFSHSDKSIGPYNFLRYSDGVWRLVNSSLQHQSRLRRPDYLAAFEDAGFSVLWEKPLTPNRRQLEGLRALRPAERFRDYPLDELAVQRIRVVARPREKGSPHAVEEAEHVVG